jgi:hypothetical protein
MEMTRATGRQWWRSKWWMPAFSVFLGTLVLIAFWVGGDPWTGLGGFVLMAVFGAVFLFGSRSETLRGLGGPGRDERRAMIDLSATAFAGHVPHRGRDRALAGGRRQGQTRHALQRAGRGGRAGLSRGRRLGPFPPLGRRA